MSCLWCHEEIEGEDTTTVLVNEGQDGMHRECFVRSFAGSVAHQQRRCSCYGGQDEDDPSLTAREAARDALLHFFRQQRLEAERN